MDLQSLGAEFPTASEAQVPLFCGRTDDLYPERWLFLFRSLLERNYSMKNNLNRLSGFGALAMACNCDQGS